MIPLIQREVVEGKKWISSDDVLDMLAIAESTPGPLAVNSATFVGYRMAGVLGSAFATIGLAIPSVVIICIISLFLTEFQENVWFQHVFRGIRSGVLVLMVNAVIKFAKKCPRKITTYVLLTAAFVLATFTAIDLKKYAVLSMICYIGMGWSVIIAVKPLIAVMPKPGLFLMLAGGVVYTIGAVLYGLGKKHRYMHSVFHFFVLGGSVLQALCILLYVL